MFTSEQIHQIDKAFETMKKTNMMLIDFNWRRVPYPSELTEMLAGRIFEKITGHDIIHKGKSCKGDLFDTTANEHIEVKSTILNNKDDATSFGAGEVFDSILFLEISEMDETATLYHIPISNIDIMQVACDTSGNTYADKCSKNKKGTRTRPHFSVKKWIIEKEGITPLATVHYKEGHWQI